MKNPHTRTILAVAAALALSSCAGLTFQNGAQQAARPIATGIAVAYVEKVPPAERAAAVLRLREAAVKLQLIALAHNPTAEAVALALTEISAEPRWTALATSIVRTYQPTLDAEREPQLRASLVDISEGLMDAARAYETSPNK